MKLPTSPDTVPVFVLGARGMLAGELLRLLEGHPGLALAAAASREAGAEPHRNLGRRIVTVEPAAALRGLADALARGGRAALVLALPHGESARTWQALAAELGSAAEHLVVVDLAADFRLRDPARHAAAYGAAHPAPEWLADFVYGLPELARAELAGARRIAAPGCFATALQLAVLPAAEARLLDPESPWILNGVTGSSGSGSEPKATTHHPHRHDNLWAYSTGGHRHEAELLQALAPLALAPELAFVACSGPFARGIHLTASLPLARALTSAEARALYAERYAGEPFVEVLPSPSSPASTGGAPDLAMVVGSNRAALAASVRGRVLTVLLTLDNLIKGGAGQGLQCLNLALGFPETLGLPRAGLGVS
jgi:N-acetyl-gamma-glutamyl-phosphate reductase